MSKNHALMRTSPKGEAFVGTCMKCGRKGLTLRAMSEECDNPSRMSQDDVIVAAIGKAEPDLEPDAAAASKTEGRS